MNIFNFVGSIKSKNCLFSLRTNEKKEFDLWGLKIYLFNLGFQYLVQIFICSECHAFIDGPKRMNVT